MGDHPCHEGQKERLSQRPLSENECLCCAALVVGGFQASRTLLEIAQAVAGVARDCAGGDSKTKATRSCQVAFVNSLPNVVAGDSSLLLYFVSAGVPCRTSFTSFC